MRSLTVTWRDVAFVHWPVDPAVVRDLVPRELSVDTYRDAAWVGAVPFRMSGVRVPGAPREFAEVNFRTYASHGDNRGSYFFSIDAASAVVASLARRTTGLPYYRAEARLSRAGTGGRVAVRRTDGRGPPARFVADWEPTPGTTAREPDPGTLEEFLVGRERYFTRRRGRLHAGTVERDPFRLRPAAVEVSSNSLFAAAGLPDPGTDPIALVAANEPTVELGSLDPVDPPRD